MVSDFSPQAYNIFQEKLKTMVKSEFPVIVTIVGFGFMDRPSRFIWHLECGKKEKRLFKRAMRILLKIIRKTDDLT